MFIDLNYLTLIILLIKLNFAICQVLLIVNLAHCSLVYLGHLQPAADLLCRGNAS